MWTIIALLQVLLIDLVMSSDNALMISMATQTLHKKDKIKAMLFGVVWAAILRILFALVLVHFLQFPILKVVGWLLLFGVAAKLYKQLRNDEEPEKKEKSGTTRWQALGLIIVADLSMSLDNVLAVAGAAGHEPIALIVGIIFSIVMMMTIATVISELMKRFPRIQWLWFAIIVFVAFRMLFAGIQVLIPGDYQTITYRLVGMVWTFGMVFLHRRYLTSFEEHEVAPFLIRHAPFTISILLLIIAGFLLFGEQMHVWFAVHTPLRFTAFVCIFLLALEMLSLEEVRLKIKVKSI